MNWRLVKRPLDRAVQLDMRGAQLVRIERGGEPLEADEVPEGHKGARFITEIQTDETSRDASGFERVEFCPTVLRDVSVVDPSTTLLGAPSTLPLAFAPTGLSRVPFTWGRDNTDRGRSMEAIGGLVGVVIHAVAVMVG